MDLIIVNVRNFDVRNFDDKKTPEGVEVAEF